MKRATRGLRTAVTAAAFAGIALLIGVPAAHADTGAATAQAGGLHTTAVKSAVWGQLHSGDCQQDNGTIVLRPDGTGTFSATTLTYKTHTGDVWHTTLTFYTTGGTRLFARGEFNSPRMNDGNPPPKYFWSADFTYDSGLYSAVDIFKTRQSYSC
jgi:hypothetical protein